MTPGSKGADSGINVEAVRRRVEAIQILNSQGKENECEHATFHLVVDVIVAISRGKCDDPSGCCSLLVPIVYPSAGPSLVS